MDFPAGFDRTTKIVSAIICLVLIIMVVALQSIIADCVMFVVLGVAIGYSPRGYVVEGRAIVVKRFAGDARIDVTELREARKTTSDDLRGAIRLFGSGGLFGYYGVYRTTKLGRCTWYVTNRSRMIVVMTPEKIALFSPDDAEAFFTAIGAPVAPA
jgi:hypothetical protein